MNHQNGFTVLGDLRSIGQLVLYAAVYEQGLEVVFARVARRTGAARGLASVTGLAGPEVREP